MEINNLSHDYYPFGLTFNEYQNQEEEENNFKFNGIELQTDLGWDNYLAEFRSYDPTIGRWGQIDPKASERESPYVGFGNNPIQYSDPLGDTIRVSGSNEFVQQYEVDRAKFSETKEGAAILKTLDESEKDITITEASSIVGSIKNFFSEGSGNKDHVKASEAKGNGVDPVSAENGVSVKVSQLNGIEVDGVTTNSTEILGHELQHASDIIDGTLKNKRRELGRSDSGGGQLRDFAETRALQTGNAVRKKSGKSQIRTHYAGRRLLNNDGTKKKR